MDGQTDGIAIARTVLAMRALPHAAIGVEALIQIRPRYRLDFEDDPHSDPKMDPIRIYTIFSHIT